MWLPPCVCWSLSARVIESWQERGKPQILRSCAQRDFSHQQTSLETTDRCWVDSEEGPRVLERERVKKKALGWG
jgi:hypothetical protein